SALPRWRRHSSAYGRSRRRRKPGPPPTAGRASRRPRPGPPRTTDGGATMQILAILMLLGGWMIAVGGLVTSEALAVRFVLAFLGLGTSLAGLVTLNQTHVKHAFWTTGRH